MKQILRNEYIYKEKPLSPSVTKAKRFEKLNQKKTDA